MRVKIKLIGLLRGVALGEKGELEVGEGTNVLSLIEEVAKAHGAGFLLSDPSCLTQNFLVLVNGREVSVLSGLETKLYNGDLITLIPISHGG